jgi:hypothetical protein
MRRPGADENNLSPTDFVCDYCSSTWSEQRPMVEGHRGSLICGVCLTLAFDELWNRGGGGGIPPESTCALCLERRDETHWASPVMGVHACKRCVKQSAVMLERDEEAGWTRPAKL